MKAAIGIPTYRDHQRITNLLMSIFTLTKFDDEYKIVMLDDGTQDPQHLEQLLKLSQKYDVPLIKNIENKGIPYSWNRLTEFYDNAEYMVLFNDDIQVRSSDWLSSIIYFLENNNCGAVGFPLIHVNPITGKLAQGCSMPDENSMPGRVGSPVGCSFGFKRSLWKQIKQPDGSVGFYEILYSFYEETDGGFEMAKMGYDSFMLPYPAVEHWGSQTFANNTELATRPISSYLPKKEYIELLKKAPIKMSIPADVHIKLAEEKNIAYRMTYARMLFAKKWGCKDFWDMPQVEVHRRIIDKFPKRLIKWIDCKGNKKEQVI